MKKFFLLTLSTAAIFYGLHAIDQTNQRTGDHAVIEIGSKNFEEFSKAEKPFILDAWAQWCGPCKMMKPIFEEVAKNNSDYVFGSLDLQKEGELGKQLQIRSLPTFIVMKEGKEYGRIIGAVASNAKDLLEKINECLANENPKEIGSNIALSPQECFLKLTGLMQKPSEKDQVEELKGLLKAGLTPDMVLMEMPAIGNRRACKLTAIYMILGTNKALLQVLLDHGADIDKVNAEIDLRINDFNKELAKMSEFKKMLQAHTEKINECLANENPTQIGSNVALSPQEYMMKLSMLMQKPSEKDQVEELKELLKAGLTPDMVFMELPAMGDRPARKFTPIYMILGTNKALLQVLLDHGADVDQVNAEIDLKIDEYNKELAKMSEFKKMLQAHTSKKKSSTSSKS